MERITLHDILVKNIVLIPFVVIFCGYVLYFTSVGMGFIPPFITSYNIIFSVIFLPFLIYAYISRMTNGEISVGFCEIFLGVFILYYANYILIGLLSGVEGEIIFSHSLSVLQLIIAFLIGRMLELRSRTIIFVFQLFLVVVFAAVFINTTNGILKFDITEFELDPEIVERLNNYQGFSFAYMIVAIYCVTYIKNPIIAFVFYIIAILCLFFVGSRADLIAFVLVIVLHQTCRLKFPALSLAGILVFGVVAMMLFSNRELIVSMLPDSLGSNRLLYFLDGSTDQSVVERRDVLGARMRALIESPFVGVFGSYPVGQHIHNVLSVWVDLGFVGFLIFVTLMTIPLVKLASDFELHRRDLDYQLALGAVVSSVVLLIMAKYFAYPFFMFALGMFARFEDRLAVRRPV